MQLTYCSHSQRLYLFPYQLIDGLLSQLPTRNTTSPWYQTTITSRILQPRIFQSSSSALQTRTQLPSFVGYTTRLNHKSNFSMTRATILASGKTHPPITDLRLSATCRYFLLTKRNPPFAQPLGSPSSPNRLIDHSATTHHCPHISVLLHNTHPANSAIRPPSTQNTQYSTCIALKNRCRTTQILFRKGHSQDHSDSPLPTQSYQEFRENIQRPHHKIQSTLTYTETPTDKAIYHKTPISGRGFS